MLEGNFTFAAASIGHFQVTLNAWTMVSIRGSGLKSLFADLRDPHISRHDANHRRALDRI